MNPKFEPRQLPIFPLDDGTSSQVKSSHYAPVTKKYVALQPDINMLIASQEDKPILKLPRRWEFCLAEAKEKGSAAVNALLHTVRPPARALDELAGYLDLLKSSSGEGAIWIFNGESGAGKTTFLQTLEFFSELSPLGLDKSS